MSKIAMVAKFTLAVALSVPGAVQPGHAMTPLNPRKQQVAPPNQTVAAKPIANTQTNANKKTSVNANIRTGANARPSLNAKTIATLGKIDSQHLRAALQGTRLVSASASIARFLVRAQRSTGASKQRGTRYSLYCQAKKKYVARLFVPHAGAAPTAGVTAQSLSKLTKFADSQPDETFNPDDPAKINPDTTVTTTDTPDPNADDSQVSGSGGDTGSGGGGSGGETGSGSSTGGQTGGAIGGGEGSGGETGGQQGSGTGGGETGSGGAISGQQGSGQQGSDQQGSGGQTGGSETGNGQQGGGDNNGNGGQDQGTGTGGSTANTGTQANQLIQYQITLADTVGVRGATVALKATVRDKFGKLAVGATVSFHVGYPGTTGRIVWVNLAKTNAKGIASVPYTIPMTSAASNIYCRVVLDQAPNSASKVSVQQRVRVGLH